MSRGRIPPDEIMTIHVTGRFIGVTSCGFSTNRTYDLHLYTREGYLWAMDVHTGAKCPYSGIKTFAQNWEIPVDKGPGNPPPDLMKIDW